MVQVILDPKHFEKAEDFIHALSPCGPFFKDAKPGAPWVFRGQSKDYPLLPYALRPRRDMNTRTPLESLVGRDITTEDQQAKAEAQVLLDFFEIADRRGLVLPDDSQILRKELWKIRSEKSLHSNGRALIKYLYNPKGPTNLLSLIALAQHYDIPTRLLDWSFKPLTAAYFASSGVPLIPTNENLVVWAFYFPVFGKQQWESQENDPLTVITAPSASNPNLAAQQGVFTLPFPYKNSVGNRKPFDILVQEAADEIPVDKYAIDELILNCRLRKFSLPQREAKELLRLLAKHDVTETSVYPGYGSIKRELEMRTYWPT